MTSREALRAAGEIMYGTNKQDAAHAAEVVEKIMAKEVPEVKSDPDLDAEYERKNRGSD